MPLVILNAKLDNPVKGIGRSMPAIVRACLREVGIWWHANLMPRHFTPGNESRYGTMNRNAVYMQEIKKDEGVGPGRYVKNVLKGKTLRWMSAFPVVTATSHRCVVRMVTPTYFDKPFVGTWIDPQTGKLKKVTRQPDKPAEATAINGSDREQMQSVLASGMDLRVQLRLRGIGI